MKVYELNKLTEKWITAGHGSKSIFQYYDCNQAYTGVGGKVKIKDDGIYFIESMYLDRSENEKKLCA